MEENLSIVDKYRGYADLVEFRVDKLNPREYPHALRLPSLLEGLPAILTVRRKEDGGGFTGSEAERLQKLHACIPHGFRYVDLEADVRDEGILKSAHEKGVRVIRSFHDFQGVPDDLPERIRSLPRSADEIPKAALFPRSIKDLIRLINGSGAVKGDKIILGMGEFGFPTRVLAAKLGGYLSFTSEKRINAAPGQVDPETLINVYRFREIDGYTALFGIIGNPVLHTRSPGIHNPAFGKLGLNCVYVPFHTDSLEHFRELTDLLDVKGFSVTIPFKERIIPFLSEKGEEIDHIGSCNTVTVTSAGWQGRNFDYIGFLKPLQKELGHKGKACSRATVIGAGGASRAVVYALRKLGMEVLIVNRTPERAKRTAEQLGCSWAPLSGDSHSRISGYADIIVQTTSVGMHPDVDGDPLAGYHFTGSEIVYDLVYTPNVTKMMKRAGEAGCTVIGGLEMLLEQAYCQFETFTGRKYPGLD